MRDDYLFTDILDAIERMQHINRELVKAREELDRFKDTDLMVGAMAVYDLCPERKVPGIKAIFKLTGLGLGQAKKLWEAAELLAKMQ